LITAVIAKDPIPAIAACNEVDTVSPAEEVVPVLSVDAVKIISTEDIVAT
jgi:hypothetical protein